MPGSNLFPIALWPDVLALIEAAANLGGADSVCCGCAYRAAVRPAGKRSLDFTTRIDAVYLRGVDSQSCDNVATCFHVPPVRQYARLSCWRPPRRLPRKLPESRPLPPMPI